MDRGLYIAASGMLAEQVRQEQISNDLANAATAGYKADRTAQSSFGQLLLSNTQTGSVVGPQSTAVRAEEVRTDFSAKPLRDTGEPLDLAIQGDGFFAAQTANGVRYTRNGQFQAGADGTLRTASGDAVLGTNGAPVRVAADGTVNASSVRVVALTNPAKQGDGLITGTPAGAGAGQVRTGALEASGADPARAMVDMIASMRAFEAGQKVIQTIDETLGRAAGAVGSVGGTSN